jgi:hypothetical protein
MVNAGSTMWPFSHRLTLCGTLVIRRLLTNFLFGPLALDLLAYQYKVLGSRLIIRFIGMANEFYGSQQHTKPPGRRVEL